MFDSKKLYEDQLAALERDSKRVGNAGDHIAVSYTHLDVYKRQELSNILTEFERIVLANPEVSFTLHHNGAELFNLPALQLRQRIMGVDVYKRQG